MSEELVVGAIAGKDAVSLEDLCGCYYHDLRWSLQPPVLDAPPEPQGTVSAGVLDILRDVHEELGDVERALDEVCGSLSAVPGTVCDEDRVTAEQWFARLPRKDIVPKPSADGPEMITYRLKKNGI